MSRTTTDVWSRVLEGVRREIGPERFNLWMRNTKPLRLEEGELVVGVPNLFILEWVHTHYGEVISAQAAEALGEPVRIRFEVDGSLFRQRRREQVEQEEAFLTAAARGKLASPAEVLERTNPRMRLETFVVGDCNRLAYSAACEVARAPGKAFNPLFIHGSVGLGKTHLLQGIAAAVGSNLPRCSCLYISCEDFTNQYITAMRTRALDAFRKRFRGLDLLVLDDVHFLTNKPATQEEFLHTFNALVDGPGKQVVLASDSHPRLIAKLKESLMTRFVAGMVARIDPPDEATRLEILRQKSAASGVDFAPGVLEFLAQRLEGSVRELEGALTMLVAHARLARREVNLVLAREVLARLGRALMPGSVGMDQIAEAVAAHFGLSPRDLRSASRRRSLTFPRQVAMFLARRHTGCSLAEIGEHFGGRDHSTAAGAIRRVQRLMKADPAILRLVEHLEGRLRRR